MPGKDEVSKENIKNQKELNSEVEKNLSFEEEILFILNKRRGIEGETLKDQQDINNVLADQTKQLKFQIAEKRKITSLSNKISKIATSAYTISRDEVGTSKTKNKLLKDQLDLDKTIQSLTFEKQKQLKEGKEINIDVANSIEMQVKEAVKLKDAISEIQEESSKVSKSFGSKSFGGLSKVVGSIPGLKGLSAPFEEAAEAARAQGAENMQNFGHVEGLTKEKKAENEEHNKQLDIQTEAKKNFDKQFQAQSKSGKARRTDTKVYQKGLKDAGINAEDLAKKVKMGKLPVKSIGTFKAGFSSLGPVIAKALGPIALIGMAVKAIKFFVDAMFEASKVTAEMSRNMLITRESARSLYKDEIPRVVGQYNELEMAAGRVTITSTAYSKALGDINAQLGVQLDLTRGFGKETAMNVAEVAKMQVNFGLSAAAATQLFTESEKTGVPLQEMNKSIFGTLGLMSVQSGIQADFTKLIEEAASIQGNLRANFKGSTENLAAAVFQAKLLGLNLSQVAGAGEKLLDFESSIGAEMEAELLTGKQLNLEKAREYALMGKTDLLMKEISEQAGTQEDFLKMNIIQRKALAKAVGLEVNELADMYSKKAKMDALAKKNLEIKNALMKDGQLILDENFDLEKASLQEIQIAAKAAGKSEAELRDILGDQIYERKEQEDASQKFAKALEQAKDAFVRLVDGGSLDAIADIFAGFANSSLFSGFKEEGEARNIAIEAEKERVAALKSAGITEKEVTDEETGETKIIQELDKTILDGKTDIQKAAIQAEIDRTGGNSSIAEEALEAQSQATGTDDMTDVLIATAAGAAIGSFIPVIGTFFGGLIGGVGAMMKNSDDQDLADETLKNSKAMSEIKVEDFVIRTHPKDELVMAGGTNLGGSGSNSSNNEVATLLKELLSTVKKGGNVYMDGALVGSATTLAYNKL